MSLPPRHKLRNRYEIEKPLSEQGAFGITYKACDRLFTHDCVVKQLRLKEHTIIKRLFEAEYKHLLSLNLHPQVPNLLDYFEERGEYYLVQEFIDGHDLGSEICEGKSIDEKQAISLVREILEILVPIHKLELIHRDIKPQNIMRRKTDNKLILIDFGAVKKITENYKNNHNQLTVCIGTPGYMAKEQENRRPNLASDIYAVGITGIFALLGTHPNNLKSQNGKIIWRDRIKVSPEFASILDKMTHPECNMRYSHATEALKDIDRQLFELPRYSSNQSFNLDRERSFGQKLWNFMETWRFE